MLERKQLDALTVMWSKAEQMAQEAKTEPERQLWEVEATSLGAAINRLSYLEREHVLSQQMLSHMRRIADNVCQDFGPDSSCRDKDGTGLWCDVCVAADLVYGMDKLGES